jgi:hypothetical protein
MGRMVMLESEPELGIWICVAAWRSWGSPLSILVDRLFSFKMAWIWYFSTETCNQNKETWITYIEHRMLTYKITTGVHTWK